MCDASSKPRTKIDRTVCKPRECHVNRVKSCLIILPRIRPYFEPLNNRIKSYANRVKTVTNLA